MADIGKKVRMERLFNRNTGKIVITPMDHGLTDGPIKGLDGNMQDMINKVADGGADCVLLHKGIVDAGYRGYGKDVGLIIHLSGGSKLCPDPLEKVIVTTVEEAIGYGADGISVHVNVGSKTTTQQFKDLGQTAAKCKIYGMPLIAMMYPRGKIKKDDKEIAIDEYDVENVKIAARQGAELGADVIKTNYTGDVDSFNQVVKGCPVPVVMAGGKKKNTTREFLGDVYNAMQAGARGVAVGRNFFQAEDPVRMVEGVCKMVHQGWTVDEVLREYKLK